MSQGDFDVRCVIGPPGTGKTTHVAKIAAEAAERFGSDRVVIASLTRAAAHEISSRKVPIPKDAVGTMHSLAYRALGRPSLVTPDAAEEWTAMHPPWPVSGVQGDFAALKAGDDHGAEDSPDGKEGDRLLARTSLLRSRLVPRHAWPDAQEIAFDVAWEAWKRERDLVDFQDMIDLALRDVATAPGRPSVLYLDETQDSSTAEIELAMKWGRAAGHLVAVGDADQSIYGFRGADPEAFLRLATPEHRRVLEQSWRVPRTVHARAVEWIERLGPLGREKVEYRPREDDGEVRDEPGHRYDYPASWLRMVERDLADGRTVMILASCAFMLDPVKRLLREEAIAFHNPFRAKRGDWNPLRHTSKRVLDYLAPSIDTWGEYAVPWTWRRVWSWLEFVKAEFLVKGTKTAVERYAKTQTTMDLPIGGTFAEALENLQAMFRDDLVPYTGDASNLRRLLMTKKAPVLEYPIRVAEKHGGAALREQPRLVLGTIHSTKGAESQCVYLIPDIAPSARRQWVTPEGETATRRLFYVGMTRAREKLVVLGDGPFGGVLRS